MISTDAIKTLRSKTGASISDVKAALEKSGGDIERAFQALERSLGERGGSKIMRSTREGVIDCYIHSDRKIGVLVELLCETDFVARTEEFRLLAHDVALHIAAANPLYIRREDVPAEVVEAERRLVEEEAGQLAKPREIIEQIITGKMEKHFGDISLYTQPFVKNPDKTVGDIIVETAGKFGENIKVNRFVRFSL